MKIVYVIPSYQRAHLLKQKTLAMLARFQVLPRDIHIFIVDSQAERTAYHDLQLSAEGYHMHYGPVGLHHMRNFITSTFPNGTCMVSLDDDLDDLVFMKEDTRIPDMKSAKRYPLTSYPAHYFVSWMHTTFEYMLQDGNPKLFGVYPVKNGYFMKSTAEVTTGLSFCVGVFWGCVLDSEILVTCEEKEDVERSLLYYLKSSSCGVLRFNHIAPVTKYYKTIGGMQSRGVNRVEAAKESARKLVATFPDLCSLYTSKKSGIYEVRFRKRSAVSYPTQTTHFLRWLPT